MSGDDAWIVFLRRFFSFAGKSWGMPVEQNDVERLLADAADAITDWLRAGMGMLLVGFSGDSGVSASVTGPGEVSSGEVATSATVGESSSSYMSSFRARDAKSATEAVWGSCMPQHCMGFNLPEFHACCQNSTCGPRHQSHTELAEFQPHRAFCLMAGCEQTCPACIPDARSDQLPTCACMHS